LGDPLSWKIEHRRFGESHFAAAIHSRSRKAEAIVFDWNRVRLSDLAANSDGPGWDIATVVDGPDHFRNAEIGAGTASSAEWSRV
jgi:hypothetical protein